MARKNSEIKIIARAWKDKEFKKKLLTNPRAAFKECGFDIPQDVSIKVIPEKANEYCFVLPEAPSVNFSALSETELEHMAGGQKCPTGHPQYWSC